MDFEVNTLDRYYNFKHSFKPDDKLLLSKVLDQAFLCERDHILKFSLFINSLKCQTLVGIIRAEFDVDTAIFGGIEGAERVKIGIAPTYAALDNEDFPIDTMVIKYSKFKKSISHRDILGSVLNLGINRDKIGDILVFEEMAYVFLDNDISGFVSSNLEFVGGTKVKCQVKKVEDLYLPLQTYEDKKITVDEPYLSSVIATVFKISNKDATALIKSKKVMVDWGNAHGKDVREKTTVTVRGFGRIYINEILGQRAKGKYHFNVHVYK